MSDDNNSPPAQPAPAPPASPMGEFYTGLRETILEGKSVYGAPDSPRAKAKLEEIEGRLAFMRSVGDMPPEPAPKWSHEALAKERLAAEFPGGDPAQPMAPALAEHLSKQVAALAQLDAREQATRAQRTADDIGSRTSPATMPHAMRKNPDGTFLSGTQMVDLLLADAGPAITHLDAKSREALRLDRQLLETYAVRGRNITAYSAARSRYRR